MKVISAEVLHFGFEAASTWHPVLLCVHTDEGISGLGEVGLAYGTGHRTLSSTSITPTRSRLTIARSASRTTSRSTGGSTSRTNRAWVSS